MSCDATQPALLSWKTVSRDTTGRSCRLKGLSARHKRQFDKLIRDSDGSWKYESNEEDEEINIAVPIPYGSSVTIEHVAVGNSKETLGIHTCP